MKKEEFTQLGISEELAEKAAQASKTELENYAPKTELEAVTQAKDQLEKDIKDRDKQLETLKKSAGNNEELQKQITDLQAENKTSKEKYEEEMKELKLSTAIKVAIASEAQDVDIVSGLVDKSKLILSDEGKVTGLDEQIKTLRESKSFLFKEVTADEKSNKNKPPAGYKPRAGETNECSIGKNLAEAMNKANETANNPFAKAWG